MDVIMRILLFCIDMEIIWLMINTRPVISERKKWKMQNSTFVILIFDRNLYLDFSNWSLELVFVTENYIEYKQKKLQ